MSRPPMPLRIILPVAPSVKDDNKRKLGRTHQSVLVFDQSDPLEPAGRRCACWPKMVRSTSPLSPISTKKLLSEWVWV